MADSPLATIIAGGDPLASQMLQSYQGAQLANAALDPNFGHNEGAFGALAKLLAGMRGSEMLRSGVGATTGARIAAQPEEAKLLASPDPYQAVADNPDQYSPLARAMVLNGATPGNVAEARLKAAQAAFALAQGKLATAAAAPMPPMYAGGAAPSVGGASGPPAQGADLSNPADLVGHFESEGLAKQLGISPYSIGVGGADLSKAPLDQNGFPIWEGHNGSHAAGRYQFQPGTWAKYAPALDIKDFSAPSQDAVFRAAYLNEGFAPWAPYNPKLADVLSRGQPGASSAGGASGGRGFDLAEGDSIGVGFQNQGSLAGNSVGGRNPQAVLDNIAANLQSDPNYYRGKNVILSPGVMNGPDGISLVPQQVAAIQGAGGRVVLAGADQGKFAPLNSQLQQIAAQANVPFAGPLPTNDVHPGPQGYRQYLASAQGLLQPQPRSAGVAAAPVGTPSGVAQLAAAGQPQIDPAYIAEAQRRANINAALGRQTPGYLGEAASLPFVGPKTAAEKWAGVAPDLTTKWASPEASPELQGAIAGEKARNEAPYKWNTLRPGQQGGFGANMTAFNPPMVETYNPDSGMYERQYAPAPPGMSTGLAAPGGSAANAGPPALGTSAPPASMIAKPGPGVTTNLEARARAEQEQRQKVIDEASAAQQSRATLMNMANEAGNFVQGPFAEHYQQAARYLRLINPNFDGQVGSFEDFVKNAGSLTRQAVHEVSSRAAVQEFTMIGNTLPNPEQSPQGLRRVQNELIGLTDYKVAKSQAQAQWEQAHGGPGNVTGFETAWQKQASPYAFIVARMAPEDRKEMFAKLQGSDEGRHELQRLGEQLQFLKQSGFAQ